MERFTYLYYNFYRCDKEDIWALGWAFILFYIVTSPSLRLFFMGVHVLTASWIAVTQTCKTQVWISLFIGLRNWPCLGKVQDLEICTQLCLTTLLKSKSRIQCDFHCFSQSLWDANILHIFKEQNLSPKTVQNSALQRKTLQDLCYWTGTRNKRKTSENSIKMTDIREGQACHEMRDFLLTDEHLWTLTQ